MKRYIRAYSSAELKEVLMRGLGPGKKSTPKHLDYADYLEAIADRASEAFPAKNRIRHTGYSYDYHIRFEMNGSKQHTAGLMFDRSDLLDVPTDEAVDTVIDAFDDLVDSGDVVWRPGCDPSNNR